MGSCTSNQRQSAAKDEIAMTNSLLHGAHHSSRRGSNSSFPYFGNQKPKTNKRVAATNEISSSIKKVLRGRPQLVTARDDGRSETCTLATDYLSTPSTELISPPHPRSDFSLRHRQQVRPDTRDFAQEYLLAHRPAELGHGIAGRVHECVHRATLRPCAVKVMEKSRIRRQDRVEREIALLRSVRHPNIVRLHDAYEDEVEVRIVTELCRGGELFDRITEKVTIGRKQGKTPTCFREEDTARIVRMLVSAVSHLHSRNIVHRDIKPENILFTEKNDDDKSQIKLIDFGLSIKHRPDEPPLASTIGTPYYMAPEVLDGCYDRSCDMWSVGVIAYVMLSGLPPFNGRTDDVIYEKIRRGRFRMEGSSPWDDGQVSDHGKDFIRKLLDVDTSRRWTADMALDHPWLKMAASI